MLRFKRKQKRGLSANAPKCKGLTFAQNSECFISKENKTKWLSANAKKIGPSSRYEAKCEDFIFQRKKTGPSSTKCEALVFQRKNKKNRALFKYQTKCEAFIFQRKNMKNRAFIQVQNQRKTKKQGIPTSTKSKSSVKP
jgi:hypothetical protein